MVETYKASYSWPSLYSLKSSTGFSYWLPNAYKKLLHCSRRQRHMSCVWLVPILCSSWAYVFVFHRAIIVFHNASNQLPQFSVFWLRCLYWSLQIWICLVFILTLAFFYFFKVYGASKCSACMNILKWRRPIPQILINSCLILFVIVWWIYSFKKLFLLDGYFSIPTICLFISIRIASCCLSCIKWRCTKIWKFLMMYRILFYSLS